MAEVVTPAMTGEKRGKCGKIKGISSKWGMPGERQDKAAQLAKSTLK